MPHHEKLLAGRKNVEERRQGQRTQIARCAKIIVKQQPWLIDCTVRDLTNRGACLEVANSRDIPEEFDLTFSSIHTCRKCNVIWRTEHRLGIFFKD
jgi:hypothetical protein